MFPGMSPVYSEFNHSPLKARLNREPGHYFAHLLREKEASWGSEFRKAFKFRLYEYFRDGRIEKLDPDALPLDQGSRYRTINLEFEGKVVATVTLYFPKSGERWQSIDAATIKLPEVREEFYSQIDSAIEIKNLVIHPEFRGTDVIMRVFQIVHRELVRSGRKLLVTSCVDKLISKYEKIAFKKTGITFQRSYGKRDELHLLTSCQFRFGAYGLHVGPLKWGVYLSDIAPQLAHDYKHGPLQRLVLGGYALFSPFAKALHKLTVYLRWLEWQHKRSNSPKIFYLRYFRMLGLL